MFANIFGSVYEGLYAEDINGLHQGSSLAWKIFAEAIEDAWMMNFEFLFLDRNKVIMLVGEVCFWRCLPHLIVVFDKLCCNVSLVAGMCNVEISLLAN